MQPNLVPKRLRAKKKKKKEKKKKKTRDNELRIVPAMMLFVEYHGSLGILSLDLGIGSMLPCLRD